MKGTHLKVLSGKKNSLEALYWLPINREKTLDQAKGGSQDRRPRLSSRQSRAEGQWRPRAREGKARSDHMRFLQGSVRSQQPSWPSARQG